MTERVPVAAGSFYPRDAGELAGAVDALLAEAAPPPVPGVAGLVLPHAAYRYSGPVAATGYACLEAHVRGRDGSPRTVAVLGPSHFVGLRGMAVPTMTHFVTPLGKVPSATPPCSVLVEAGLAVEADAPHAIEHSLEVQLPFLQRVLGDGWSCVPIAVGDADADRVADALDAVLASDPETVVVVSTDLSHYHDQTMARLVDVRTAQAVVALDDSAIESGQACGAAPLRGLLVWARRRGLRVRQLDLRTSADTAGDPNRVVGYGAFAVHR